MRALLLTVGSQGDVQPFVALANRLRSEGHDAVLAAPAVYQGLAATCDVPFVPLGLDMNEVGDAVAGKHGLKHVLAFTRAMGQRVKTVLPAVTAAARDGADVVVHHPVLPIGQHVAEMLGVPAVLAPPMPALVPTGEFLSPAWPCGMRLPKMVNRPSYRAARYLTGAWCRRDIDGWRRDTLALSPRSGRHDPLSPLSALDPVTALHSFSAHVVPRPADWPVTAEITGYWFLGAASDWTPPRRLAEFIDAGEPPVYIGFGSMPVDDPAKLAEAIITAVQRTGLRAVVSSLSPELRRLLPQGSQGQQGSQSKILMIRQAPHDWLFPRMAAIVHHGGAGTTGAAVMAGRPQVIWPFGIDQHFWSSRMISLGVAVRALPVRAMTGASLAQSLDRATNDQLISDLAVELGHRVRAEDGTGCAVSHLERIVNGHLAASGATKSNTSNTSNTSSTGNPRTVVPA
jgi:sterol 3beta-glucosyltransferase